MRPAHPHPRWRDPRRGHTGGGQSRSRDRRPGRGVPPTHPGEGDTLMSLRILASTTGRILRQLRHDRRSLAMVIFMPLVLLTLVYFMWENQPQFNRIALVLLGVFPFIIMFLLTTIAV